MVIGSGLAGLAAACRLLQERLSVLVLGPLPGNLALASGSLDFLGVSPADPGAAVANPWPALAGLRAGEPRHPYAKLTDAELGAAWQAFARVLAQAGLPHRGGGQANLFLPTSWGAARPSYLLPEALHAAAEGLRQQTPALLVDFAGMREFNARLLAERLRPCWPGLQSIRIEPPLAALAVSQAAQNQLLAEELDSPACRRSLARALRPRLGRAQLVGLPAVLGLWRHGRALREMQELLGVPVCEIPTLPPSMPGLRLSAALQQWIAQAGGTLLPQRAVGFRGQGGRVSEVLIRLAGDEHPVRAQAFVLAAGRFLGSGLEARLSSVQEPLFGLPVSQPRPRSQWHREDFWDQRGQPLNRAGLETDEQFRPLGPAGGPAYDNLFAAGGILAHQDWVRQMCGAGLSIATGWAAAARLIRYLG